MSDIVTTVTPNCGNGVFAPGGSISITSVTGGSDSKTYSIYKTDDPNYDDALSNYGTATTFNVDSYGTYQIRVKDACNAFFTKTVEIQPSLPPVKFNWLDVDREIANCTPGMLRVKYYDFRSIVDDNVKSVQDYLNAGGFKLKIWKIASGSDCAPVGDPIFEQVITTTSFEMPEPGANNIYYMEMVSPCGETASFCYYEIDSKRGISATPAISGCGTDQKLNVIGSLSMMNYPVNLEVIDNNDSVIKTETISIREYRITDLPLGTYTIKATDECGGVVETTVTPPAPSETLSLSGISSIDWACVNDVGLTQSRTLQVYLRIKGYLPDMENATITIISGPSNVGSTGGRFDNLSSLSLNHL